MGSTLYKMKLSETNTAARPFEHSLLSGEPLETYAYDPFGRRASTTAGDVTVRHVYDGAHCVADTDATGTLLRSYTWGPGIDNLLAVTCHSGSSATTYYALTDIQGTVHGFADADGNLVARYAYDAWGNLLDADVAVSALANNRYLFQGREYSHASGLYNFRLRWYDPATGRWLSKDPIGISGGLNLYAFCGNDPVNGVDPMGLVGEESVWKAAALGFAEGWSRGAQGVVNAFTGGLFIPEAGFFYDSFNEQWENIGYESNDCNKQFDMGMTGGRVAEGALLTAGVVWGVEAAGWINTTPQGNNIFRIISKPLRRGWRLDKPHHGKGIHPHYWKW